MGICTLYLFLGVHVHTCEDTHAYYVHMYTRKARHQFLIEPEEHLLVRLTHLCTPTIFYLCLLGTMVIDAHCCAHLFLHCARNTNGGHYVHVV